MRGLAVLVKQAKTLYLGRVKKKKRQRKYSEVKPAGEGEKEKIGSMVVSDVKFSQRKVRQQQVKETGFVREL
ncbi:hypothetical protein E2C01_082803 [Portunus trituberculatus]|uniref:Uncharacterized protein n=1 Tax=Portunus trituberculatus TaxID=210409 RepID=A0A5B7IQV8_PORTR|nr:hypothetical protein [Portunus trituberculatus]